LDLVRSIEFRSIIVRRSCETVFSLSDFELDKALFSFPFGGSMFLESKEALPSSGETVISITSTSEVTCTRFPFDPETFPSLGSLIVFPYSAAVTISVWDLFSFRQGVLFVTEVAILHCALSLLVD